MLVHALGASCAHTTRSEDNTLLGSSAPSPSLASLLVRFAGSRLLSPPTPRTEQTACRMTTTLPSSEAARADLQSQRRQLPTAPRYRWTAEFMELNDPRLGPSARPLVFSRPGRCCLFASGSPLPHGIAVERDQPLRYGVHAFCRCLLEP